MQALRQDKSGICNNCTHNIDCVMEQNSPTPIVHCNDYAVDAVIDYTLNKKFPIVEMQPELKGLCGYCEHKVDCTIKSKNEIIITCEEYK